MAPPHPETTEHPEATEVAATEDIRVRMRRDLVDAMKARDQQAVAALRSTLAAIDNAEAVDAEELDAEELDAEELDAEELDAEELDDGPALSTGEGHPPVAGSVLGVGAADVERRVLTPEETADVVRDEVTAREVAADVLERSGRADQAERLRAQAKLLTTYLDPPGSPPTDPRGGG
jgi:uncharacterized protein YqeY